MIINQWVPAAHRGDAIGDSARRVRDLLRGMGHDSDLFALTIDDDLREEVRPFSDGSARRASAQSAIFGSRPSVTARRAPCSTARSRRSSPCSTSKPASRSALPSDPNVWA